MILEKTLQQMIMIKTWQQTLQCELLLASACKVDIEIDDDMMTMTRNYLMVVTPPVLTLMVPLSHMIAILNYSALC